MHLHRVERIAEQLLELIRKFGFEVSKVIENSDGTIIINFYDPRLGDDIYYYSSIAYQPSSGRLEATVRVFMSRGHKEFYLDYCVEDGEFVCRPHVWNYDGRIILSNVATFHENPLEKLRALLNEYSPLSS